MELDDIQVVHLPQKQKDEWFSYAVKSWDNFEEIVGKEIMDTVRSNSR